jgi:hypothetical protein
VNEREGVNEEEGEREGEREEDERERVGEGGVEGGSKESDGGPLGLSGVAGEAGARSGKSLLLIEGVGGEEGGELAAEGEREIIGEEGADEDWCWTIGTKS